ncbi:MAG: SHOCT domain-containing protein [Anaerolineae bacterium]|jgi:putative membrane protein
MMMGGVGWLTVLIVLILFLLLIGGAVAAVIWFARQGSGGRSMGQGQGPRAGDDALEILRRRYARGEIDREEFQRMREDLTRNV